MIRLTETGDPCQAAQFANAVASFSIEGPGVSGIPMRQQVEYYLERLEDAASIPDRTGT
jgi:sugar/nucleoside kinase (ribokinase family)